LIINNNAVLNNIDGLSTLTDIWGDLQITNNSSLTSIDGLSALTRVFEITIQNNSLLDNVNGFSAITNVSRLVIRDNEELTNVEGLSAMAAIWNDLTIQDNAKLSRCTGVTCLIDLWDDAEPGLGDTELPDVGDEVFIKDNLSPCNSVEEILSNASIPRLNAGLNDAWYDPVTSGQGFFISVFPDLGAVSLAWFTYDTELPAEGPPANLGDADHCWLTAIGPIIDNQVMMDIEKRQGKYRKDKSPIH
jgi:hypothetical protein